MHVPTGITCKLIKDFFFPAGDCDSVSHRETVQLPPDIVNQTAIQFRWLQQEQAWHDCNCWQISDVSLTVNNSQLLSYFGDGANDLNK